MVDLDGAERSARLANWAAGPMARAAHPREDHFIPVLGAVGAAEGERGVRNYHEAASLGGHTTSSAYRIGSPVGATTSAPA